MDALVSEAMKRAAVVWVAGTGRPGRRDPNAAEPEPTEPKPAEPEPAEPKPAEPKPAEPEPAEPETAEPEPAEPEPAEPEPAEPDGRATAVWCLPIADALYVVSGGGEQPAPGLVDGGTATLIARGDHGGRIASFAVRVTRIPPGTPDWDAVAVTLASKRLNTQGTAEALAEKWAEHSAIWRLAPPGDELSELP